jgi:pSer/pThr/pTyr-binding forkhead associated (FHA) protein
LSFEEPTLTKNILNYLLLLVAYLFLFWVFFFAQRELRKSVKKSAYLKWLTASTHKAIKLEGEVVIGRGSDVNLRITDPHISTTHAKITYKEGRFWLEDLKSKNGTRLNGKLISRPEQLKPGDKIELANHVFLFEVGNEV